MAYSRLQQKMYETRAMTNVVKDKTVLSDVHTQDLSNVSLFQCALIVTED